MEISVQRVDVGGCEAVKQVGFKKKAAKSYVALAASR